MARHRGKWALWIGVAAFGALAIACGGDENEDTSQAAEADDSGTVDVTLQEWAVVPSSESSAPGEIAFDISNNGTETHEFVVLSTDLALDALPTAPDGSLDEEGGSMVVVDEVEDLPAGDTTVLEVDLDAGSYVLACNIVDEEGTSHFSQGMRTAFTVE